MKPRFGPAGNPDGFYAAGNKSSLQMPGWLKALGLDAYEYQCGNGVNISLESARRLGEEAKAHNVRLSLHSPYFIALSSPEEEKQQSSLRHILKSAAAAKAMGADRVVVHCGAAYRGPREPALRRSAELLQRALYEMREQGFGDIHLCPETMGKINQLGNLDEVLTLCSIDDSLIPVIDFGHLNARSLGSLKTAADFERIFDEIENRLGFERLKTFHSHFSKIEYTSGGERRHLTFEDTFYGPDFEPVAELICKKGLAPVMICESAGTQAEDALMMKRIYEDCAGKSTC